MPQLSSAQVPCLLLHCPWEQPLPAAHVGVLTLPDPTRAAPWAGLVGPRAGCLPAALLASAAPLIGEASRVHGSRGPSGAGPELPPAVEPSGGIPPQQLPHRASGRAPPPPSLSPEEGTGRWEKKNN